MAAKYHTSVNPDRARLGKIVLFSLFAFFSLSMVVLIALSVFVPPAINDMVEAYTAFEPARLPEVTLSESEREEIEARLEAFGDALKKDEVVYPLELTEEEINGLLSGEEETTKGYLSFQPGYVQAQLSLPMESDIDFGPWRASMQGRYVNGVAKLKIEIEDDILRANLISFQVKGKTVPRWLRKVLQREIDKLEWLSSPEVLEVVSDLDDIEFQNGRLILHPK